MLHSPNEINRARIFVTYDEGLKNLWKIYWALKKQLVLKILSVFRWPTMPGIVGFHNPVFGIYSTYAREKSQGSGLILLFLGLIKIGTQLTNI